MSASLQGFKNGRKRENFDELMESEEDIVKSILEVLDRNAAAFEDIYQIIDDMIRSDEYNSQEERSDYWRCWGCLWPWMNDRADCSSRQPGWMCFPKSLRRVSEQNPRVRKQLQESGDPFQRECAELMEFCAVNWMIPDANLKRKMRLVQ